MKCFITGVSGFVGPYLARNLLESGHTVSGIDREGGEIAGCKVISCDLLDKKRVFEIVAAEKPDTVFHLAAQSSVPRSWEIPELTKKINVEGTRNLLDAVIAAGISPKILIVSSAQIYGVPEKLPITEKTPLNPQSPYAESRVEQELLVQQYSNKLKFFISRSFNHTGPGQPPTLVCPEFAKQIADIEKGKSAPVISVGNLESKRDFSDVRDVVSAYLLIVEKGVAGEVYNVCSGKAYSAKDVLDMLLSMSKVKVEIQPDPAKLRKKDVSVLFGSYEKLKRQTSWAPQISFKQTLKDVLEYWRAR